MAHIHFSSAFLLVAAAGLGLACAATSSPESEHDVSARHSAPVAKPTVVLVHGAFADASGWTRVITLLQRKGFEVVAVQNGMTSLADDVATTRRVIDAHKGPVVLVGHSYGGAVITATAAATPNVKALVYIAAFAPDAGETLQALLGSGTPSKIGPALVPDAAGFLYIDRERFREVFAADVKAAEASAMAATQRPIQSAIFTQSPQSAAWRTLPSWYLIATEDQAIHPDLQRMFAERMRAKSADVRASHVPFLSQPEAVVRVITDAAGSIKL